MRSLMIILLELRHDSNRLKVARLVTELLGSYFRGIPPGIEDESFGIIANGGVSSSAGNIGN